MKRIINKAKLKRNIANSKQQLKIRTGVDDKEKLSPVLKSLVTGKFYNNTEEEIALQKVLDPILAANKELERAALNAVLILEEIMLGGKDENRLAAAREILSKKIPTVKVTDITSGNKPLSIEFISMMPTAATEEEECHKD